MNEMDINKKQLGVAIPLELFARIRRYSIDTKLTMSEAATIALMRSYKGIVLSSQDIEWIYSQMKSNEEKRNRNRNRNRANEI